MSRSLLALLIFAIFIAFACAIICYDCDSLHDPRCNEYFAAEGVKQTNCDTAEMPEYLEKYRRRIEATGCLTKLHEGVEDSQYFVRRSCYFGKIDDTREACDAEDPYLTFADVISCHVCEEDLCNTNAASRFNTVNILFALFLSCMLFMFK